MRPQVSSSWPNIASQSTGFLFFVFIVSFSFAFLLFFFFPSPSFPPIHSFGFIVLLPPHSCSLPSFICFYLPHSPPSPLVKDAGKTGAAPPRVPRFGAANSALRGGRQQRKPVQWQRHRRVGHEGKELRVRVTQQECSRGDLIRPSAECTWGWLEPDRIGVSRLWITNTGVSGWGFHSVFRRTLRW